MYEPIRRALLVGGVSLVTLSGRDLTSQVLPEPTLRAPGARAQAAHVLDVLKQLRQAGLGPRYARTDTVRGGVTWIEFEPSESRQVARAATPEAAAAKFLGSYSTGLFGIDPDLGRLQLVRTAPSDRGRLFHFRYVQHHGDYRVLDGQLVVHMVRVEGGFGVQSANGWVFPGITGRFTPNIGRASAERAAQLGHADVRILATDDTLPVIVAHDEQYRLAYRVPVFDPSQRAGVTRYIDAATGVPFAETSDGERHTWRPNVRVPSPAPRPSSESRMSRPRAALVAGFVTAQGTDWWDDNQTFKAYNTGTGTYELRDDGHPGASEIRVRDYNGSDFFASCSSSRQYVTHTSTTWATDPYGLEEVSAVHHLGETVSFFKNTYDRDGMENTGGALLACVHGDAGYYQAAYDPTYNSIKLSQETAEEGPSAAAQDAVTHEFAHGIIEAECWAPTREPSPFGKRWPTFSVLGTAVRDASAKVS